MEMEKLSVGVGVMIFVTVLASR